MGVFMREEDMVTGLIGVDISSRNNSGATILGTDDLAGNN